MTDKSDGCRYHSWATSVSVCQMIYHMVTVGNASKSLSIKDLFCLFIAALSIGIDHSGTSPPVLVRDEEEYANLMVISNCLGSKY